MKDLKKLFPVMVFFGILLAFSQFSRASQCDITVGEDVVNERVDINTDVPNYLVGAKITVTLADGTSSTVPAEKFKVVKRQQQFLVTKTTKNTIKTCKAADQEYNKNILSGMVGYGLVGGLEKDRDPTRLEVETKVGPSVGIQYQRRLNERFTIGIQGQTNGVGSGLLGVGF